MRKKACFSITSITSSQACDAHRGQMAASSLPVKQIRLQHFIMAGNFLSKTNTRFIMGCTICTSRSVCILLFLIVHPLLFFFFVALLSASFSTCAGCTPRLQTRLCVFPAFGSLPCFSFAGSLPHHPGNLTIVCPSPPSLRSLSNLTSPQKGQQTHPRPDTNTLNTPLNISQAHGAKVSSHCIM